MGLQRRGPSEALVAHLALVLLLGVGRHLRAELAHHRLGSRGSAARQKIRGTREGSRQVPVLVRFGSRGAVVGHRRLDRCDGSAVVRVVSTRGDRGAGRVSGREAIGVARSPGATRAVDVPGGQILAESDHSAAGVKRITERRGRGGLRRSNASSITVTVNRVSEIPVSPREKRAQPRGSGGRGFLTHGISGDPGVAKEHSSTAHSSPGRKCSWVMSSCKREPVRTRYEADRAASP